MDAIPTVTVVQTSHKVQQQKSYESKAYQFARQPTQPLTPPTARCQNKPYDSWKAYSQSKLANLLHAKALAKKYKKKGIAAVAVHPGFVDTGLMRSTMPSAVLFLIRPYLKWRSGLIDPWEGAQTSLFCALDPSVDKEGNGKYHSQANSPKPMHPDRASRTGGWPMESPHPTANDEAAADKLYQVSRELVGLGPGKKKK